jgi:exonuclease SbcD
MKAIIDCIKEGFCFDERNVLVTHGFIRGIEELETSDSEKLLSIGGAEYVDVNCFKDFTYTALGHLHGPQKVGSDRVRYAGSLMRYSFSEVNQKKSVTMIEIGSDGELAVTQKQLSPKRNMRKIRGELQQLLAPDSYDDTTVEDYLQVTLTDEGELIDPMHKLRTVYPNVMELRYENRNRKEGESRTSAGTGYKLKSKLELFEEFYNNITGREFTPKKATIVAKTIANIEKAERGE